MKDSTEQTHGESHPGLGVWLAGAGGDIATTSIVGTRAIARRLADELGLVSSLPQFTSLGLASLQGLRFGGLDVARTPLPDTAEALHQRSRTVSREILDALNPDLATIESDILRDESLGWSAGDSDSHVPLANILARVRGALRDFRDRHALERVIVVNLISAGPTAPTDSAHQSADGLLALVTANRRDLITPSMVYALAALTEGCPFINFTPNPCTAYGGICELADRQGVPIVGDDGKTGETLVKTALAPMFAVRNLRVLSWEGVNLLGNADGRALHDPQNRTAKIRNKEQVLGRILGYAPHAGVDISYVPSLGDWKTAWDLIHFQGFLGVAMTMQFTWQGCDSILAAPLVLDLVRFADIAARHGESGPMSHLAVFFKNPLGCDDMALPSQFERLLAYARAHGGG
jgi:myo-inositol-1-phosphate synthase